MDFGKYGGWEYRGEEWESKSEKREVSGVGWGLMGV